MGSWGTEPPRPRGIEVAAASRSRGCGGRQASRKGWYIHIYIYMFGVIMGMFGVYSWVVLAMFGWVYRSTLMDLY